MDILNQNMQVIIAALVILAVLLVAVMVWRAFSPTVRGRRGQRLGISEYHELDKTRRLVLVRRDDVEHLVLIGGPQDVVIETGIATGLPDMAFAPSQPEVTPAFAPVRPPPRPPVFGDRRPPALRTVEPPPLPVRGHNEESV
jgi:hypothetical protein